MEVLKKWANISDFFSETSPFGSLSLTTSDENCGLVCVKGKDVHASDSYIFVPWWGNWNYSFQQKTSVVLQAVKNSDDLIMVIQYLQWEEICK